MAMTYWAMHLDCLVRLSISVQQSPQTYFAHRFSESGIQTGVTDGLLEPQLGSFKEEGDSDSLDWTHLGVASLMFDA